MVLLEKQLGEVDPESAEGVPASKPEPAATVAAAASPTPLELCLCLDDFEQAARAALSKRAWTYYCSASENLHSFRLNRQDWERILFRPRVLRNVQRVNMQRTILGHKSSLPLFIAPAALARLGHPDGELCLSRGASAYNIPFIVSTASSVPLEDLVQSMPGEIGQGCLCFQLYVKKQKSETLAAIVRAKQLGFKALLVTVDTPVVGKREEDDRYKAELALEAGAPKALPVPMKSSQQSTQSSSGDDVFVLRGPYSSTLDWDELAWMREAWGDDDSFGLKGIATAEDALLAYENGIKRIYLSNHGGRQLDSAPSSLRTLLEMCNLCPHVLQQCEVLVDGGVRRATDIIKALCLGARGVGLGRPFLYALSAHGTPGVCKAIQSKASRLNPSIVAPKELLTQTWAVLSDELETSMRLLGVVDLDQLGPHLVNTRELDPFILPPAPAVRTRQSRI
jgi:L-lactate dehydrogenase (cytochrome)